jgi:hypothetical protein
MPPERQGSTIRRCWTCRVRRKRCEPGVPGVPGAIACKDCTFLGLECHNSVLKPTWMDNGARQRQMADRFKAQVREITSRRARLRSDRLAQGLDESDVDENPSEMRSPHLLEPARITNTPGQSIPTPPSTSSCVNSPVNTNTARLETNSQSAQTNLGSTESTADREQSDIESSLLMSYLDYAFPVLFPFYRPSVFEGGRAWLLTLALKHPAFYHNIVGLAAYFYCAVPVMPGPSQDACAAKAQSELQVHMNKAVQGVQDSLRNTSEAGVHYSLVDNILLLGNIIQLVNFEVAFAPSNEWQIYLGAAANLLAITIDRFGNGDAGETAMTVLLRKLRVGVPSDCSVWSPDQAALRFFAAVIIHQDIIASTALQGPPMLSTRYHELLVQSLGHDPSSDLLNLEDFTGCPNWVMGSIARTSSLNKWKTKAKEEGNLDMFELVERASVIKKVLRDGHAMLDDTTTHASPWTENSPYQCLESILARSGITSSLLAPQLTINCNVSSIWACAAEVYLITVLSGWQPGNALLRSRVAQALDLLTDIDNPSWLRTLSWPFCIVGCMAAREQQDTFRHVANASGGLAVFGTLRDALAIMEKVWRKQNTCSTDTWDIAYCLRILGHSALLV